MADAAAILRQRVVFPDPKGRYSPQFVALCEALSDVDVCVNPEHHGATLVGDRGKLVLARLFLPYGFAYADKVEP